MSDEEEQYSGYPLSYSSSSGGRRSSATPGFSLRSESSASSINSREPFSRGSRARDSLATRSFARGGGLERELSSRVSRDDHTSSLLERYGGSSSSAQKNHPGETSTMQLLRQRREQNDQGRRSSMDPHGESIFDNLFRDQPSTSWGFERTAPTRQTVPDAQDVNQSEYMNRLLAAHNRVDELLRSRGKNCEDERKYMRTWEEIPLIREERYLRLRTPSISSDSGLSTDNDSDKSNAEAANAASEEPHASDSTEKADETETETETEDSEHVINVPVVGESEEEEEEEAEIEESYHLKHEGTYFSAQITLPIKTQKESVSLSVRAVSDVSTSAECVVIARPVSRRKIFSMSERVTINEKAKLQCLAAEFSTKNMVRIMKKKAAAEDVSLVTPLRNDHARIKARFPLPADDSKNQVLFRRRSYDDSVKIQQKCVLASLKRRKLPSIPSSAEISIQHCSFYSQFAKDNFVEKNVRMNLRMTERAPKNCTVVISLPAPPRIQYASLDIPLKAPVRQLRRSQTLELTKKKKVGKLTRSFTMDIEKEEKEQRKVNRLVIPDFFLQSNAEALEEWKNSQGVKKVSIIGGFVITAAPKTSPQQQLRRAGAIRRRPPPQKEVTAPYLDFLPAEAKILPEVPKIRIVKPPDPDPPPLQPSRSTNQSTGHLNLHGSLERTVKPSGATKYESPITELSDADKILIEQYRQKLHIPKPRAIFRAISPIGAFRSLKSAFKERCSSPPPTEFIRAASPARIPIRSPEPSRKPFRLRNVAAQNKHVPRRHWLDFAVDLRKVDMKKHKERKLPRICTLKWIPKWRKRSDEEVEEVEEEEEVEVEEPSQLVDTPAVERPKTKSITEDDDTGLTEGEKAMAAAKRRQEDEDQAKLMDYEERRRAEREKEEEELKKLKEKQEKRRLEREQEEREMEERRKAAENRRREEEEEKKARLEEQRRKKEEEKNKRNQMIGGAFNPNGGRNFSIPKKSEKSNDKFGNIVQAKQEMGMTKDQQEEAKRIFIASVQKSILQASEISASDLKTKIKDLHARICKLEADKYDLEKRHERQKYDLKELNERQRQVARNSALKSGIDPADAGNSRYPPKVQIVSKYDRQIDRRNFGERRSVFDRKNAYPCFPGVLPPPAIYEKVFPESIVAEEAVVDEEDEE